MRRVLDLPLVRGNSPIFSLSWQVMHVIDENSPLYGLSLRHLSEDRVIVIVTLTGIDNTFSESVHARQIYSDLDIELGARFVDVIDSTDGRVRLDLRRFHDTVPDARWPEGLRDPTVFTSE